MKTHLTPCSRFPAARDLMAGASVALAARPLGRILGGHDPLERRVRLPVARTLQ